MKRFWMILLVLVLTVSTLSGCGGGTETTAAAGDATGDTASTSETTAAPGTAPEEGATVKEFNDIYSGEVTTLNYLKTASYNEFEIASNLVDTLIDYDPYGVAQPALAESWSVSDDQMVWTLKIREGVKWYTFDGKEYADVVAQDWVDAMAYILNPDNASSTAQIAYSVLKNGEKYYNKEIEDFSEVGVKAVDTYTLEYTLEKPTPYFLSMLNYVTFFPANGKFIEECEGRFGTYNSTLLYNGAYILETFEPQSRRIMVKNQNYWDKDKIHIEKLNYRYNKEAKAVAQELYLRGEISALSIPSAMIDEWMNDPEKKEMLRPGKPSFYTYFFALNFKPTYDAEFGPDNWKIAVNNINFRKSLFHGLNRTAAMLTHEPYDPQNRILNTITPRNFVSAGGKDYTQMEGLAALTQTESFDAEKALSYKEKALSDLNGRVTFPVKVVVPYNTGSNANADRAQVLEQQLESTLGTDYIDVIIQPYPPTGYLNATRRAGNYALQEVNWGPDYADPQTYTDPFIDSNYNFPEETTEKTADGKNVYAVYAAMISEAKEEYLDIEKRYALFAKAEAYMIENAWVIPFSSGGGGYVSSPIHPFSGPFSPFGVAEARWKNQIIFDKPVSTEQYYQLRDEWTKAREDALKKAK